MGRISVLSAQLLTFHKKCNQGQCFKVFMRGSIYIYIYVCVCVDMYICIYILPHIHTHIHIEA